MELLSLTDQDMITAKGAGPLSTSFIGSNTISSTLSEMKQNHIIPVFAKDNERLISTVEFIEMFSEVLSVLFEGECIGSPAIRLSHPIKGRIPSAKDKSAHELEEWEKTLYYERCAFIIEIPHIRSTINGQTLCLTAGGIKSYHLDKLQGKKGTDEHFSLFIGFQNKVCTNMCIWTDGYSRRTGVKSLSELRLFLHKLLENYNAGYHLHHLRSLADYCLNEQQFAHLIGKCRMYSHLSSEQKGGLAPMLFGDSQLNQVVRDYYQDNHFRCESNGDISLWNLYNLFTGSNKSSYIDSFADRSVNAFHFMESVRWSMDKQTHHWFLS